MKYTPYKNWNEEFELSLKITNYIANKNLAIAAYSKDPEIGWEPFGIISVNIMEYTPDTNCIFVDTNNMPNIDKWLIENGIGTPTGRYASSGFCRYPEYKIDLERITNNNE